MSCTAAGRVPRRSPVNWVRHSAARDGSNLQLWARDDDSRGELAAEGPEAGPRTARRRLPLVPRLPVGSAREDLERAARVGGDERRVADRASDEREPGPAS